MALLHYPAGQAGHQKNLNKAKGNSSVKHRKKKLCISKKTAIPYFPSKRQSHVISLHPEFTSLNDRLLIFPNMGWGRWLSMAPWAASAQPGNSVRLLLTEARNNNAALPANSTVQFHCLSGWEACPYLCLFGRLPGRNTLDVSLCLC